MKNSMGDLMNYLFEQIERLQDDELTQEEFDKEIARAEAVGSISQQIIHGASLSLKATEMQAKYGIAGRSMPALLGRGEQDA